MKFINNDYFLELQISTNVRKCRAHALFNAGTFQAVSAACVHQALSFSVTAALVLGWREGISLPTIPGYKPGSALSWSLP